ncbi:NUDIX domain-containing protein [Kurthia populi]|uniref:NUDIX domain-containing protein n=1 Tax=Kurthia populi TaxID=1562132 RepID=A0ABW5XWH6_9BACL
MEKWDVYDKHRMKKAKKIYRGEPMDSEEYHLVVHACIFNQQGKMLIQQRQTFKDSWPNLWDVTCGGSALEGETSQQAIGRELFEEIGLAHQFDKMRPHITVNFERGFDDYYLLEREVDIEQLVLQPDEVQAVKWASHQEIKEMMAEKQFVPYYTGILDYLFAGRHAFGSVRIY